MRAGGKVLRHVPFGIFLLGLCFAVAQENAPEMSQKDSAPTFQSKVSVVLVPVVVRDANGRVVSDLTKDDFQLFDRGKLQSISSFTVQKRGVAASPPPNTQTDSPLTSANPLMAPERYVGYLFDDLNVAAGDLMNAKKAAATHLAKGLAAVDRAAIFTTSGQNSLDFTGDKDKLQEAVSKIQMRSMYQHAEHQCPDLTYYWADLIINKNDPQALNAAAQEVIACMGLDPTQAGTLQQATQMARSGAQQELSVDEQGTRVTLSVIKAAIRRMSAMPGQRLLILASPGFLAQNAEAFSDKTDILDAAAKANVMMSSLNIRGLFTTNFDASQAGPASSSNQGMIQDYYHASALASEDVLAEFAEGTGGTFFHNNNDLVEGFNRVAAPAEVSYLLGFSPLVLKPDGSFHRLKINVPNRKGMLIQARRGYYAQKHSTDAEQEAKEDIHDAIFSREEVHDIPVDLQTQFFKTDDVSAKLTILAKVDLGRLHFKKLDGRNHDELAVVSVLFDRNGNYLMGITKTVTMRLRDESLARLSSGITVKTSFAVKSGAYVVRLVVRDSEGHAMAAQNGAVEIP